jgi:hypothetical protein
MAETGTDPLDELQAALGDRTDIKRTKMFGKHCLAARGKVMAVLWEGDVVFKLAGEDHASALKLDGAHLWDPRGKGHPMREWVQVPRLHSEEFEGLGETAYEYVTSTVGE